MVFSVSEVEGTNTPLSQIITVKAKDADLNFLFPSIAFLLTAVHSFGHLWDLISFCLFYSFCSAAPNQTKVKSESKCCFLSTAAQGSWWGLCLVSVTKKIKLGRDLSLLLGKRGWCSWGRKLLFQIVCLGSDSAPIPQFFKSVLVDVYPYLSWGWCFHAQRSKNQSGVLGPVLPDTAEILSVCLH